jgi:hypothetical protein
MSEYHFGLSSFVGELWIDHKKVFVKPTDVSVEFISAQKFEWLIADASGRIVKTVRVNEIHGGWTGINLPSLGLYQNYRIGFRSIVPGTTQIKQGEVTFGRRGLRE